MDCHGQRLFSDVLANHILIERAPDFCRFGYADIGGLTPSVLIELLIENALANVDAAIADINAAPGDELGHLGMALAAERAHGQVRSAGHIGFKKKRLLSRRFAR